MCDHNIHIIYIKKNYIINKLKKKMNKILIFFFFFLNFVFIYFFVCIKNTRVGPIWLGSAGYRKQGYYFVWPNIKRNIAAAVIL